MCRVCGRMIKCIFDSMPSRVAPGVHKRAFTSLRRPASPTRCSKKAGSSDRAIRAVFKLDLTQQRLVPSSFLLPTRAHLHTSPRHGAVASMSEPRHAELDVSAMIPLTTTEDAPSFVARSPSIKPRSSAITSTKEPAVSLSRPLVLSKSVQQLLPVLRAQIPHYITAHIHRFPYLLTTGDTLRLPFHMHGVEPGDVIRLNRASLLGSRDYTLKAGTTHTETYDGKRIGQPQYLDERLFECRARVLGVDSGPMMIKEKTKRRNRKVKTAKSKHRYTILKVMEVRIKDVDELKTEQGTLLLGSSD